jgi:hypothetical protein
VVADADLADALDAPPLARRIADQIERHASDLRLGSDWKLMAAARILADPDLAAGRTAVTVVDQLRARHQPRRWGERSDGSPTVVCTCGSGAFDACPDAQLLNRP